MALDNSLNTEQMGLPGLAFLSLGIFLKLLPPAFLPTQLIGWLQAISFLCAIAYYIYSIYKKSKEQ